MPLTRRNYIILAVGFAVILLGFILMAGGGGDPPHQVNHAPFSWRRLTPGPTPGIARLVPQSFRIMKRYDR